MAQWWQLMKQIGKVAGKIYLILPADLRKKVEDAVQSALSAQRPEEALASLRQALETAEPKCAITVEMKDKFVQWHSRCDFIEASLGTSTALPLADRLRSRRRALRRIRDLAQEVHMTLAGYPPEPPARST